MFPTAPRSGYTLPVFATAAAIAALCRLRQQPLASVQVDLVNPDQTVEIAVEYVAQIRAEMALAITRSDPGDNLDLTRNTPIWALVEWQEAGEQINIKGGEGIGRLVDVDEPAIYAYAQKLLQVNLERLLKPEEKIQVTIILPEGKRLAARTSNAAFGVLQGLSLLGTTGISQPLSAPAQLDIYREQVQRQASCFDCLVFCIGENGLDLAKQLNINPAQTVKTANWIGPMLVEAATADVKAIVLFGYHGKLVKLAGGIFHTHHHLADGRLEILTAYCAQQGLPTHQLQAILASSTTEVALKYLQDLDNSGGTDWVSRVYGAISQGIDKRSQDYIFTHSERRLVVGSVLFARDRSVIIKSKTAAALLPQLC